MDSSHNSINLKSYKCNATLQIHVFTIYYWHVSLITMEIDLRLAKLIFPDYVGTM